MASWSYYRKCKPVYELLLKSLRGKLCICEEVNDAAERSRLNILQIGWRLDNEAAREVAEVFKKNAAEIILATVWRLVDSQGFYTGRVSVLMQCVNAKSLEKIRRALGKLGLVEQRPAKK